MFDVTQVFYLALRLLPYLIVSYFTISSIFNQDVRGVLYISTLIFAFAIASVGENILTYFWPMDRNETEDMHPMRKQYCSLFYMQDEISALSPNLFILVYTLSYLFWPGYFARNFFFMENVMGNLPSYLFIFLALLAEAYNTIRFDCVGKYYIHAFILLLFSGFLGWVFSYLIYRSAGKKHMAKFLFTNSLSTNQVCSMAKTTMTCKVKS